MLLLLSALALAVDVEMRNDAAEDVLQAALSDPTFWEDADSKAYEGEPYEEVRLKPADPGYVPMIVGEGGRSFDHGTVVEVVFRHQDELPRFMEGAKAVEYLGSGWDSEVGAEYTDAFFYLDLTFFYATFFQRMYRKSEGGQTVLWFEKMDESFVDPATWARYDARGRASVEASERRWPPFNAVYPTEDIYGMFVVEKGRVHATRITFVSKLVFGSDAGWLARVGSKIPGVIRAGLRSGFSASTRLCVEEQERRAAAPR